MTIVFFNAANCRVAMPVPQPKSRMVGEGAVFFSRMKLITSSGNNRRAATYASRICPKLPYAFENYSSFEMIANLARLRDER